MTTINIQQVDTTIQQLSVVLQPRMYITDEQKEEIKKKLLVALIEAGTQYLDSSADIFEWAIRELNHVAVLERKLDNCTIIFVHGISKTKIEYGIARKSIIVDLKKRNLVFEGCWERLWRQLKESLQELGQSLENFIIAAGQIGREVLQLVCALALKFVLTLANKFEDGYKWATSRSLLVDVANVLIRIRNLVANEKMHLIDASRDDYHRLAKQTIETIIKELNVAIESTITQWWEDIKKKLRQFLTDSVLSWLMKIIAVIAAIVKPLLAI